MSDDGALLVGRPTDAELTDGLLGHLWRPGRAWWIAVAVSAAGSSVFVVAAAFTVLTGIGVWGNQIPGAWGLGIVDFVWWIGLGHAGTFISAILLLLEQRWRTSINRIAEAMTLFAVAMAGMFPLLHLGRPWFAWWLVPYPSTLRIWPQFRSALVWDLLAITTYFTVSLMFWYLGLIPDLAAARDRAPERWRQRVYGFFALGFRGSTRHWHEYRSAYHLLASLAAPLVISVHSIISFDFAESVTPGWHSTLFPPMFVIGAVHSGFALVILLLLGCRRLLALDAVITWRHFDACACVLLATASLMGWCYGLEAFSAWLSGDPSEIEVHLRWLPGGTYAFVYWGMIAFNSVVPQVFWLPRARRSGVALAGVSALVLVGMWLERFAIVPGSLARGFLPSAWRIFVPSAVDGALLFGTLSAFCLLFILFMGLVPPVSIAEVKRLSHELGGRHG